MNKKLMAMLNQYEHQYMGAKTIPQRLDVDNECYEFLERVTSSKKRLETYWQHYKRHSRMTDEEKAREMPN